MTSQHQAKPRWKTSSRCNNGDCVAVALLPGRRVGIRDTKQEDGPILTLSRAEWSAFVERVKAM